MANLIGSAYVTCPFCCEPIKLGEAYVIAPTIAGSPINGLTIHGDCSRQREHANEGRASDKSDGGTEIG